MDILSTYDRAGDVGVTPDWTCTSCWQAHWDCDPADGCLACGVVPEVEP